MPRLARQALTAAVAVACLSAGASAPERASSHSEEIARWRAERLERLRSESGWLSLVGLHWLEDADNPFGTDASNAVVLPEGTAPPRAGSFVLEDGRVRVVARPEAGLTIDGVAVLERGIRTDADEAPDDLRLGRLRLMVIRRGERLAVRVRDPESPARKAFRGIEQFPVDARYRIDARWVAHGSPREVAVPTVLGTVETMRAPGVAHFTIGGKSVSLEPVVESASSEQLFFIFKDATSGKETYGPGRFLYADAPRDGRVTLDFNKAYNPPCAFTPYATCPLPPKRNWLPVRIPAGEKAYAQH